MQKRNNHCIAVIGDGAITGGMAYEAMNHAGFMDTNMIVILNDNQQARRRDSTCMGSGLQRLFDEGEIRRSLTTIIRLAASTCAHLGCMLPLPPGWPPLSGIDQSLSAAASLVSNSQAACIML